MYNRLITIIISNENNMGDHASSSILHGPKVVIWMWQVGSAEIMDWYSYRTKYMRLSQALTQALGIILHQPYSPDVALLDYHLHTSNIIQKSQIAPNLGSFQKMFCFLTVVLKMKQSSGKRCAIL